MKKNRVDFTRLPGKSTMIRATIAIELDAADQDALKRFGNAIVSIIPPGQLEAFRGDFEDAIRRFKGSPLKKQPQE